MNERIKELLEQAGYYPHLCDPIKPNFHDVERTRYLKLIDLMIEECAGLVATAVDHRIPASEYPQIIRAYFKENSHQYVSSDK